MRVCSSSSLNIAIHSGWIIMKKPDKKALHGPLSSLFKRKSAMRWMYSTAFSGVTWMLRPLGFKSTSSCLPYTWRVAVKTRPRSETTPGLCLSFRKFSYSSSSKDGRSFRSHMPPRNFFRKNRARGSSSRMPSYMAFPSMQPRNSSKRGASSMSSNEAGLGYSSFCAFAVKSPYWVWKPCLIKDSMKSLNKPPPSTPASGSPCSSMNWTRTRPLSPSPSL
mmetsp:Transcript_18872/g.52847  ORF Transcript_18872/g.52847 Transcript_18872/m.52847 type:complete len:220 (-) Transcript_18872:1210-1869(-)